jgi:uncharacterized membrane protein
MTTTVDEEIGNTAPTKPTSRAIRVSALVLSVVGLGLSTYLSIAHFAGTQILACSSGGFVDCAQVTTSPQSYFLGIPVAFYGLAFFLALITLCLPWTASPRFSWAPLARYALATIGVLMVAYLVYAELALIGAICIYCTAVHVTTLAVFVLLSVDRLRIHTRP